MILDSLDEILVHNTKQQNQLIFLSFEEKWAILVNLNLLNLNLRLGILFHPPFQKERKLNIYTEIQFYLINNVTN
jgi:hypothetical protein